MHILRIYPGFPLFTIGDCQRVCLLSFHSLIPECRFIATNKKDLSGIKGYGHKKCVEQRYVWPLNFLIFDQLGRKRGNRVTLEAENEA